MFTAFRCASLLVALASAGLWVRSHYVADEYTWPVKSAGGSGFDWVVSRTVATAPGRLTFQDRTAVM